MPRPRFLCRSRSGQAGRLAPEVYVTGDIPVSEPASAARLAVALNGADVLTLETRPAGDESFGLPAIWIDPIVSP